MTLICTTRMSYFAQQSQHPKPWLTDPKLKSQYNPIKEAEREIKMKKKMPLSI